MKIASATAFAAVLCAVLFAAAAQKPPEAAAIIEKYIEATGGRAAVEKLQTQVLTGTIEIVGKNVSGVATVYRAAPNKALSIVEFSGLGKVEEGTDGEVAWSRSAGAGARLKEGSEKAFSLRGAIFHGDLNWRDHYVAEEKVEVETVEGRACYKVVLAPKDGSDPIVRYYDRDSGFLVKIVMSMKSPQGEVTIESLPSDYRQVGELLIPHKVVQRVMGNEIVTTFTRIENNPEIPAERFALPEDVKALLARQSK